MSKTGLSRRAALTGAAALPLAAALAIPAAAESTVSSKPDPILAAIAEHRRLDDKQYEMWGRLQDPELQGQREADLHAEHAGISDAAHEAGWMLTKMRPTTAAGAGALVAYVRAELEIGGGEWQMLALDNATAALKEMETPVPAIAAATGLHEPDPIFAAIAAHRQAWKNLDGCSDLDAAETPEADAELERLWGAEENARKALVNPTTIAGAGALLRYTQDHQEDIDAVGSCPNDLWVHGVYLNVADMLEGHRP